MRDVAQLWAAFKEGQDSQARDLLVEHTAKFEKDPKVRCVVIRGAGDHFQAGGDIKGFHKSLTTEKEAHLAGFEMRVVKAHQAIYQIRRMNKPVIASVHGAAAGFGLSLILNCDLGIAADDSYFTLAYRHIGLSADGGATYFLPRVVGERKALEIALLGERFTAQEAKEQNILNWVVPKAQLAAETEKLARKLADGPTFALGVAKRLIRTSFDNSWDEHSHREAEGLAACAATDDHFEGLNAFLEKRKAVFKGS